MLKYDFAQIPEALGPARRALEVAAAGGHNVLFTSPPQASTTMLARRLVGILPLPEASEIREYQALTMLAGLGFEETRPTPRPFRAPHHTVGRGGLLGSRKYVGDVGELALAHCGVLYLDELPEFDADVLLHLRAALRTGATTFRRGSIDLTVNPLDVLLVASRMPCPCGQAGTDRCSCSDPVRFRYLRARTESLRGVFDLRVTIPASALWRDDEPGECSDDVRTRVEDARRVQKGRAASFSNGVLNSKLTPPLAIATARVSESLVAEVIQDAGFGVGWLGPMGLNSVLRVARTVADLSHSHKVEPEHLLEALDLCGAASEAAQGGPSW